MGRMFTRYLILLALPIIFFQTGALAAGVQAKAGVLDFSTWNFETQGPTGLDGEWEFYWNQLVAPDEFQASGAGDLTGYIQAPGYWDGYDTGQEKLSGVGYATFRLQVENLDPSQVYMMYLPLMHTAYKLWVNGNLIASNGTVGMDIESSKPQYLPVTTVVKGIEGTQEFVLQVSNFHHNNGGIWQTLKIGLEKDILHLTKTQMALDMFLLGAIFIMALYHFALFALRRKEGSTLLFGLFCLVISFRISVHGATIFSVLFPNVPWELLVKLDYFTLYFGVSFFCSFIHKLYPDEFSPKVLKAIILASSAFIVFSIVTPALIFTAYLIYFQGVIGLSILYFTYVLIKAIIAGREGAKVVMGGCVILIITFVNDVLYNHEVIHTADMVGMGLFLMIFSQSYVLSFKFSKAFKVAETLSVDLEQMVKERTAAIKDLLDNTGQGFFSFSKDYKIQKYTSKATRDFFDRSIEDEDALTLMFPEKVEDQKQLFNLVFENTDNLDLVNDILPKELTREGRIYKIDYHWIDARENVDGRVMVVMTDITTQRKLEQRLIKDEQKNQMIVKIAVDRHGFIGFINEVRKCLDRIFQILSSPLETVDREELFRHYHTIKGGMASYSFQEVVEKAHEIESLLDEVRRDGSLLTKPFLDKINSETQSLVDLMDQTLKRLDQIVPKELIEAGQHNYFRIPESKIISLEELLVEEIRQNLSLRKAVTDLRKQPIRNIMKKLGSDAQTLAEKMGKNVQVRLLGEQNEIIHEAYKELFASLIHLIRNCVDHGFETPDVRFEKGKPEVGTLELKIDVTDSELGIVIGDDGAGIDAEIIRDKALEKDLLSAEQASQMSNEELVKMIFQPGFSTNEDVTDLSGRGVGMDAVADEVAKLKGKINVRTKKGKGTQFLITVPAT